jgi:DNA gyrase subunit A
MGRVAAGVRGVTLKADDFVEVMAAFAADDQGDILVVAERGFGKRTPVADFREQGRGGKGITLMRVTPRTGNVAGMRHVQGDEDIMLVTAQGMMIRTSASGVRRIGRATQGVKLIELGEGDQVVAVAKLAEREEPEDETDQEGLF